MRVDLQLSFRLGRFLFLQVSLPPVIQGQALVDWVVGCAEDEMWKRHRRILGPSMSKRYLERMSVRVAAGACSLVRLWRAKDLTGGRAFNADLDLKLATMVSLAGNGVSDELIVNDLC